MKGFPTSADIYLELDGRKIAVVQSYRAKAAKSSKTIEAFGESEPFSAGTLPGLLMAEGSRAAMEVEDISRAVQRDARRYDGGFTMF